MYKRRKASIQKVAVLLAFLLVISLNGCKKDTVDEGNSAANDIGTESGSGTDEINGDSSTDGNSFNDSGEGGGEGSGENEDTAEEESEEHPLVPDFTLESSTGDMVSLSDYAGKVVVLNFWASWCPPCKKEMPDFQKLYEELEDSEDTVLLMLDQTDGQREKKSDADKYVEQEEFTFPVLYDTGEVGYSIFGLTSIPTTVVIDKEGRLSDYVVGSTEYDVVAGMIEEAK